MVVEVSIFQIARLTMHSAKQSSQTWEDVYDSKIEKAFPNTVCIFMLLTAAYQKPC